MRTLIPKLTKALGTNECVEKARGKKKMMDDKQKERYDRHARSLNTLQPGAMVWIQNPDTGKRDNIGKIIVRVRKRTYKINLEDGKTTHRHRRNF